MPKDPLSGTIYPYLDKGTRRVLVQDVYDNPITTKTQACTRASQNGLLETMPESGSQSHRHEFGTHSTTQTKESRNTGIGYISTHIYI